MADLRIFSYLPNPRLFKATIAARYSGATIDVVGAKPRELASWLWDYEPRALADDDPARAVNARRARTGFSGELYKTDAFLVAHPFGDVPAGFAEDGAVGVFESNSIMRAAARLGPNGERIYGGSPALLSRIDGFLDRALVFARETQRYLLSNRHEVPEAIYDDVKGAFASYLGGVEQALASTKCLASDHLTLADIAFACELGLLTAESAKAEALARQGLTPVLAGLADHPKAEAHLGWLASQPNFSDLAPYFAKLGAG